MADLDLIEYYPDFFVSEVHGETLWLKFSGNFFHNVINFDKRDFLSDYFGRIRRSREIKTVIFHTAYSDSGVDEYLRFFLMSSRQSRKAHQFSTMDSLELHRFCNTIDRTILDIVELNKFTMHICQGATLNLFLNISLACDYGIIGEKTTFYNTFREIGILPKGGGAFFLTKMLGRWKANELLLLQEHISAEQAGHYGLVNRITTDGMLEKVALEVAGEFNALHPRTLAGVKKLTNYPVEELKQYLAFETAELLKIGVDMQFEGIVPE